MAKTNVLRFAHNPVAAGVRRRGGRVPAAIATDYHHVDACCMYMVTKPKVYDVIVTTNMFGDIITDLGAAIQGGMGMAASGNLNPTRKTGQHVRARPRQRPRHRRQGVRQPDRDVFVGGDDARLSTARPEAAKAVHAACKTVVADPKNHTRDLGGTASTGQVGDAVVAAVGG